MSFSIVCQWLHARTGVYLLPAASFQLHALVVYLLLLDFRRIRSQSSQIRAEFRQSNPATWTHSPYTDGTLASWNRKLLSENQLVIPARGWHKELVRYQ